jgi:hypothetical protein
MGGARMMFMQVKRQLMRERAIRPDGILEKPLLNAAREVCPQA